MEQTKIDDKGRIRLSKQIINLFKDNSSLSYDFDLINSKLIISTNYRLAHRCWFQE